jgi:polyhydroxybutyrate depolymerase
LVIVLHGARLSAKIAELVTEFDKLSNEKHFIVVYPNAIYRQWNDGRRKEDNPSYGIDDVKFISQLIDYLIWKYHINPKRVYVAGYSSGGMLSQKLGMEVTDKIAAIAEVASSLPLSQIALNIKPTKPLPVLMINGTNDPAFPWGGGTTSIIGIKVGPVAPVMESAQYWIDANGGLTVEPRIQRLIGDKKGKTTVDMTHFSTKSNAPVILYKINGGGHTWPGSEVPLRSIPFLGRQSKELNGSELIWEFFKGY